MRDTSAYEWHLRQIMATRGMFITSELQPLLAEQGIHLSREQTYRIVTGKPQRLALDVLAALCHILECGPQDLIEVGVRARPGNRAVPRRSAEAESPEAD